MYETYLPKRLRASPRNRKALWKRSLRGLVAFLHCIGCTRVGLDGRLEGERRARTGPLAVATAVENVARAN